MKTKTNMRRLIEFYQKTGVVESMFIKLFLRTGNLIGIYLQENHKRYTVSTIIN